MKTTFELNGKTLSRTQLPLRLAWAVTIHKSQGLTLDRIKLGLGKKEFSTGLTFVALSRVKKPDGIMIVDRLDFSRVQKLGGKHLQHRFDDYARRYPRNIILFVETCTHQLGWRSSPRSRRSLIGSHFIKRVSNG
jgi:hypothetical protein